MKFVVKTKSDHPPSDRKAGQFLAFDGVGAPIWVQDVGKAMVWETVTFGFGIRDDDDEIELWCKAVDGIAILVEVQWQ